MVWVAQEVQIDFYEHQLYVFVDEVVLSDVLRACRNLRLASVTCRGDYAVEKDGSLEGRFMIEFEADDETTTQDDLNELLRTMYYFVKSRARTNVRRFKRDRL